MQDTSFENYLKAQSALKDILFMYKTLIDYSGLFDDLGIESGKFDPFTFIDCDQKNLISMKKSRNY